MEHLQGLNDRQKEAVLQTEGPLLIVAGAGAGGVRAWTYRADADALTDALRLSRGMSYKNAMAGLPMGGGKAVIIGNPATDKSEALFRAFGQFVESLGGRYITAGNIIARHPEFGWNIAYHRAQLYNKNELGICMAPEHHLRFAADEFHITVFPDGRALIEGTEDTERALAIYDRWIGS